jgi:hypothetical protein
VFEEERTSCDNTNFNNREKYLEREAALIKYVGVNIPHTVDKEILKGVVPRQI